MVIPSWGVEYLVVLGLGVIVGLLLRFIAAVVAACVAGVGPLWLLGDLPSPTIWQAVSELRHRLAGLPLAPQALASVIAGILVAGLLLGVLLTTPLPGRGHPA